MTRTSAIVLVTGAVALLLAGCGQSSNDSADANGLRKGGSTTSATSAPRSPSPAAAPTTGTPGSAPATEQPGTPASGDPSKTTCAEFRKLDVDAEKSLIEQILADNPDSTFAGSPNVALGTAKLVCLSGSVADTPVAVAAGIVPKNK
ncbi:hypothetical protein DFR70_104231 [Nocardia tenerifensis]|uniref:DUF732 domain-containing protein n=1 Tax=Nocardia tenerifensis TaxID=228006 RepID=A0A318K2T9_9NOCA|nr:hypothetical protein [Nocardia tenerifensis]PXX65170.1 hypothetical protein DFR70_104231 [Nocardia tenerifensis]